MFQNALRFYWKMSEALGRSGMLLGYLWESCDSSNL